MKKQSPVFQLLADATLEPACQTATQSRCLPISDTGAYEIDYRNNAEIEKWSGVRASSSRPVQEIG